MTKILVNETNYENATTRLDELMNIKEPRQDEIDEMELLAISIEHYEEKQFPI